MCSRHVHILPRIEAYSILLFPLLIRPRPWRQ
nr:MAG TPA: hypothetical protein [Caudoviricetes sp.]